MPSVAEHLAKSAGGPPGRRAVQDQHLASSAPSLSRAVSSVLLALDHSTALRRVVDSSPHPMVVVDQGRRYTHANQPARLLFRKSLEEMLELRIEDLTASERHSELRDAWNELLAKGSVSGDYEVAFPEGGRLDVVYWALREPCPGEHLIVFAPSRWPANEFSRVLEASRVKPLTEREIEVLWLAAEGNTARRIAERLVIADGTVKTHLTHIYEKLGARDRAAAVAQAMRLGLIA
jgi:DNA-binding CsgD family transcriptional regulator